jgi:hypothetical protein
MKMSNEENELQPQEEEIEQEEVEQEEPKTEVDEEEVKAKQHGWDPSKGDKTAREFNLTGELIEAKKHRQKLEKDLETVLKYQENVIEAQKLRFKQELDYRLQEAKQQGDMDKVEEYTKEKVDIEQRERLQKQQDIQAQIKVAVENFAHRNSNWYNPQRQDLVDKAVRLENEIISGTYAMKTGIPQPSDYEGVLKQIETVMRFEHPDLLDTSTPNRPVLSSARSGVNKSIEPESDTTALSQLSKQEKEMFDVLKRIRGKDNKPYSAKEFLKKVRKDSGEE